MQPLPAPRVLTQIRVAYANHPMHLLGRDLVIRNVCVISPNLEWVEYFTPKLFTNKYNDPKIILQFKYTIQFTPGQVTQKSEMICEFILIWGWQGNYSIFSITHI